MNILPKISHVSTETEYIAVCEICGSTDQVQHTADPDRGGLLLCRDCRRVFGFEAGEGQGVNDGENH